SSRRRHTRSKRDWSSDVCSSDLTAFARALVGAEGVKDLYLVTGQCRRHPVGGAEYGLRVELSRLDQTGEARFIIMQALRQLVRKIGRASCRARGETAGGDGAVKT